MSVLNDVLPPQLCPLVLDQFPSGSPPQLHTVCPDMVTMDVWATSEWTDISQFLACISKIPPSYPSETFCEGSERKTHVRAKKPNQKKPKKPRHEPAAAAAALDYISKAWGSGKVSESDTGSIWQQNSVGRSWAGRLSGWNAEEALSLWMWLRNSGQKSWLLKTPACPCYMSGRRNFAARWICINNKSERLPPPTPPPVFT